jgi:hypothetical protein
VRDDQRLREFAHVGLGASPHRSKELGVGLVAFAPGQIGGETLTRAGLSYRPALAVEAKQEMRATIDGRRHKARDGEQIGCPWIAKPFCAEVAWSSLCSSRSAQGSHLTIDRPARKIRPHRAQKRFGSIFIAVHA